MIWSRPLPRPSEDYERSRIAYYFLALIAIVSTVRSLIHIFALDGGANSIAGIAVDVDGGVNIVVIFAQWGASQLILAIFYWLAIVRYRFLIPFMLATVVLEQALRIAAGLLKPIDGAAPPPGAIGSYVLLQLSVLVLFLSLRRSSGAD